MKLDKPILTHDHGKIINAIWDSLDEEHKEDMARAIIENLKELHPEDAVLDLRFTEVMRASWSLGFHCAMKMIEAGLLFKTGPISDPEKN